MFLGKVRSQIDDSLTRFIQSQHVFFVSTAPLDPGGHLNLSPKGLDSFRILSPTTVAYVDLVGSGVETIAHLKENGRIVLMFCAFDGPPTIVRIYGTGRVVEPGAAVFSDLAAWFPNYHSTRAIIVIEVTRISDSCGFGVPLMQYEGDRNHVFAWAEKKGPEGLEAYKREKNRQSIDGLPGLAK